MKIQVQDEQGNKLEPLVINVAEGELILVRVTKKIKPNVLNNIGRDIKDAAEHNAVLIIPNWIELIVVKDNP